MKESFLKSKLVLENIRLKSFLEMISFYGFNKFFK